MLTPTKPISSALELVPAVNPASIFDRFLNADFPLLFESGGGVQETSRYTYITADPIYIVMPVPGGCTVTSRNERLQVSTDIFDTVKNLLQASPCNALQDLPPFQGGAAGFWGYDLGQATLSTPVELAADLPMPQAKVGLYDWVIAYDRLLERTWICLTNCADPGARLQWIQQRLGRVSEYPPTAFQGLRGDILSTMDRISYVSTIERIQQYIRAGDAYQVNLSHRLSLELRDEPWRLYTCLSALNPVPYAAYLKISNQCALISYSPEEFVRVTGDSVLCRPMKGTRRRCEDAIDDRAEHDALARSEKDRAENLMIVDLMRNDLGKVCQPGTIRVPTLFAIEPFAKVWQMVSTVTGVREPGVTCVDILKACFPCGSVTGAPKTRAMQIIAELEPIARQAYCGAIGYIGWDDSMTMSVAIRTIVASSGRAYVNVGGGIVADSDPAQEYEETLLKAKGVINALEVLF